MSAFSDYLEEALLAATLCGKAYTPPTEIYLGLFTSATTDAGGGTEVIGGGYQRIRVTFTPPKQGPDGDFFCANDGDVRSPAPSTAAWGGVTHFALYDAKFAGNRLYHGPLVAKRDIGINDLFFVQAGDLSIKLS